MVISDTQRSPYTKTPKEFCVLEILTDFYDYRPSGHSPDSSGRPTPLKIPRYSCQGVCHFGPQFEKRFKKIKNQSLKDKLKKQIAKVINNPGIGKPMKYARKGTREIYVVPFRLSYAYIKDEDKIIFLDFYHKDWQ